MRIIGYNSQRDNNDFDGKFRSYWQCFSTSAWMFMSYYTPKIKALSDIVLSNYIDDVEMSVGKTGIAEKTIARLNLKISGNSSFWWKIQQEGINSWLKMFDVKGECVFHDGTFAIDELPELVIKKPVIIGTNKIGNLPGGHIILLVDYDMPKNSFVVNDPFGNARTNYLDINGELVLYGRDYLTKYITISKNQCRCMFWNL
jgi:hypothetical protein